MSKQWWFLFVFGVIADGPASIFVWWYLWQWRTVPGLGGKLARYMSLMALGHCAFTLLGIIAWIQPLTGITPWYAGWYWGGRILLSLPLWALGFVLFRQHKNPW
jgi:hypothetical protein